MSKQCDHSHEHGTTRGVAAVRSERYTPALVRAMGQQLLLGADATTAQLDVSMEDVPEIIDVRQDTDVDPQLARPV
eukprot:264644-Heterocapsa_arctica.AAC.1